MRILNSCVIKQVSNFQSWVSTIPAAFLFCSTAIRRDEQPDVFAVVICPVVTLSVFCSTVSMRSLIFLRLWTALTYSTECIPLLCLNALSDIFAVMNCSALGLTAVFCSGLITWRADKLCSLRRHIVQQRVRRMRVE